MDKQTAPYVFISYAHQDANFVSNLISDLRRHGISVWVDTEGLAPGTPNWQQSIRQAVRDAAAVLVAASPASGLSVYVHAELQVAASYNIPIYPLWSSGDRWVECVPLELISSQYIDCRAEQYKSGVGLLLDTLVRKHFQDKPKRLWPEILSVSIPHECPPDYLPIIMARETVVNHLNQLAALRSWNLDRAIAIDPRVYPSFQFLLDKMYVRYLSERYPPYKYGQEWIIASATNSINRLIVPWEWIVDRNTPTRNAWEQKRPLDIGMSADTTWAIYDHEVASLSVFGIFTSDPELIDLVLSIHERTEELEDCLRHILRGSYKHLNVRTVQAETVDPAAYQHCFVFSSSELQYHDRMLLVVD